MKLLKHIFTNRAQYKWYIQQLFTANVDSPEEISAIQKVHLPLMFFEMTLGLRIDKKLVRLVQMMLEQRRLV